MFRSTAKKAFTLLAAAFVMFLVVGCGRDMATTPVAEFTGQAIRLPESERAPASEMLGHELPSVTVVVSATEGGRVTMGRYTLDFPPGALAQDTPITIQQVDPAAMVIELKPHGIHFNRVVTLSARIGGLAPAGARTVGVGWLNPETGKWEMVDENGASAGIASAGLWHFSDYMIFEN